MLRKLKFLVPTLFVFLLVCSVKAESFNFSKFTWNRHSVPEERVSADFPADPTFEEEREDGKTTKLLFVEKNNFRLEISVAPAQRDTLKTSQEYADSMRPGYEKFPDLDLISLEPRPLGKIPGVMIRTRNRNGARERSDMWSIMTKTRSVNAQLVYVDDRIIPLGERFWSSLKVDY